MACTKQEPNTRGGFRRRPAAATATVAANLTKVAFAIVTSSASKGRIHMVRVNFQDAGKISNGLGG